MSDSLNILNIEDFKLDIIYYIGTIVYETWWTSEHYRQKYYEIADIYNITVKALSDFISSDYLKLGQMSYSSINYYIVDCSNKKMLERSEKKWIELSILYYSKYRHIEDDKELIDMLVKEMRENIDSRRIRTNGIL